MNRYFFYSAWGLSIYSEFDLGPLHRIPETIPDVSITKGAAVEVSGRPRFTNAACAVSANGSVQVEISNVARFSIEDGERVIVTPEPTVTEIRIRSLLLDRIMAIIHLQRNNEVVCASGIRVGTGAVLFSTSAGDGRSCLAARFTRAGYDLIGDDYCVISSSKNGDQPQVMRGFSRLCLWQNAFPHVGLKNISTKPIISGRPRFEWFPTPSAERSPLGLLQAYRINRPSAHSESARNLSENISGLRTWSEMSYLPRLAQQISPHDARFLLISEMVSKVAPQSRTLPFGKIALDQFCEEVENDWLKRGWIKERRISKT